MKPAANSASVELLVTNCPNNDLAKTNQVFASARERWANAIKYLEFGGMVYSVDFLPVLEPGQLAMNSKQRQIVKVSTGDKVRVTKFVPPTASFNIVLLNGEVRPVSSSKARPGSSIELNAIELSAHLLSRYVEQNGSTIKMALAEYGDRNLAWTAEILSSAGGGGIPVLCVYQEFMFEFQGTLFFFKATGMIGVDKMGGEADLSQGMLTSKTSFVFETSAGSGLAIKGQRSLAVPQLFKEKGVTFEKMGIGGLDTQFVEIFRRAFQSRHLPHSLAERLGVPHVKGMLLHGPPGTGKTLIARQIGKMLNGKEPKIVNGPEVLNKYVGASEENIRGLFKDAEKEQAEKGEDSDLHIIIFDEIDAICKQRGSVSSGTGVHDTVVNQLLTKIDGVDALNNILLIGMTNRKDMLDEALLRPGRLEVQVEIGLPDSRGRLQILKIHTSKMLENSFLAQDVNLEELAELTKNFSGAEIQGLVKSAISFALNRQIDVNNLSKPVDETNLKVTMADFHQALAEVKPAFGAVTDTLESYRLGGMINYGARMQKLIGTCDKLVRQVREGGRTSLMTCLLEGPSGSGKTALAATLAVESNLPFVKVISSANMMGFSESAKGGHITKIIEDAYRSQSSLVILDNIERLVEYVPIGPRFSNSLLQIILELLEKQPPKGRKLMVIGTSSDRGVMENLGLVKAFTMVVNVPLLNEHEIRQVFVELQAFNPQEVDMAVASLLEPEMSVKRLLLLLELAREGLQDGQPIHMRQWQQILRDFAM